jgi:hypothetical protein
MNAGVHSAVTLNDREAPAKVLEERWWRNKINRASTEFLSLERGGRWQGDAPSRQAENV